MHLGIASCLFISVFVSQSFGCHPQSGGWGADEISLPLLPKPTLIPKLVGAFHDGKKSVNVKAILHPKGFKGLGWGGHAVHHKHNHFGDYEYGYAVHAPYTGDAKRVFEKSSHGGHVKGHYAVNDLHSFKNVNYDTSGWGEPAYGLYHPYVKK